MRLTLRDRLRSFYRALFPEGQSAVMVAVSVFLGVFIGVFPTIGFALPLTAFATSLFRLPKGPGLLASFVATPPTLFMFFYPLGYLLGKKLTAPPAVNVQLLVELRRLAPSNMRDILGGLWRDARPHVLAFILGMIIVSLMTAILVAAASYWVIVRRKRATPD